jgi:hypothetical protein
MRQADRLQLKREPLGGLHHGTAEVEGSTMIAPAPAAFVRLRHSIVLTCAFGVTACATDQSAKRESALDAVECAALSAVLDSMTPVPSGARLVLAESTAVVVVADSAITATWSLAEYLRPSGPLAWVYDSLKLSPSTIKSFRTRNRHAATPCKALATRGNTAVLPDSIVRSMVQSSLPEGVGYLRFPDSTRYVFASRVGISGDQREALLTFSYLCGRLCLTNMVVVLSRIGDEPWKIKYSILAGVS